VLIGVLRLGCGEVRGIGNVAGVETGSDGGVDLSSDAWRLADTRTACKSLSVTDSPAEGVNVDVKRPQRLPRP
jgi:hypothetical protein